MLLRGIFVLGIMGISAATGIVADQIYYWLEDGVWLAYHIEDLLARFHLVIQMPSAPYLRFAEKELLQLPVTLVLFTLGIILSGIAFDFAEPTDNWETDEAIQRLRNFVEK